MVSEVMLQQTQVLRVIPKYKAFIRKFPTVRHLAKASLRDVLSVWSGLGYNRRAKYLHEAAKLIMNDYGGVMPRGAAQLETLPGIGTYTARAIATFAYNTPEVFIETNIRTVFIHHFSPGRKGVRDRELLPVIEEALPKRRSREWYAALMDYGAHLKVLAGNANQRSAHYTKQKRLRGSLREARGLVLKTLSLHEYTKALLVEKTKLDNARLTHALEQLFQEGFIQQKRGRWTIV